MLLKFKLFAVEDAGAVTVDWVVLTAAIVTLALSVLASVSSGAKVATENISSAQDAVKVERAW